MLPTAIRPAAPSRRALLLLPLGIALALTPAPVMSDDAGTLKVEIAGLRSGKGIVRAGLFKDAKGFPSDWAGVVQLQEATLSADGTSAVAVFKDVAPGRYAVSVIHDENSNGKLDKNFVGKPTEGYGASNNPKKRMGAPPYEEAVFTFDNATGPLKITIIN
jgi:uncharacterized protein (DUF2141 family)